MQTIDMTPTWAALMPAFIAALQCGTPEGQAMAREELGRLAAAVDASNARIRSGAAEEERNRFGAESVALGRERAAVDLARAAEDFRATGAHDLAAAYFEAAARIAPAAALAHDMRVAGGLEAARASSDLRQALQEARESGAAEARAAVAADLATWAYDRRDGGACHEAAALFAAAAHIAPEDMRAGSWGAESRQCEKAARSALQTALEAARAEALPEAQAARAEAMRQAHAEGRRAGMEEARAPAASAALSALLDTAGDVAALLEVATGGRESLDKGQARATIRDLRKAAAYFRPAPVQNSGAAPVAKDEGAAQ